MLAEAIRVCATPLRSQGRSGGAVRLLESTHARIDAGARYADSGIVATADSITARYTLSRDRDPVTTGPARG
ncbi:hypothetical protein ACIP88_33860 [Streptomyces uncialis]|uniref:hypothetical protein n=1 Tax=Streptomyces uncialis TaxID=1048205 RepID=UPI00381F7697